MGRKKSISAALHSIPSKKESLRRTLEELQKFSASLASFTIQWRDLEEHFDSMEKEVRGGLKEIEEKSKKLLTQTSPEENALPTEKIPKETQKQKQEKPPAAVVSSHKLKMIEFCKKMDSLGLKKYISESQSEFQLIRDQLAEALQSAPDPVDLVLDTTDGFYRLKANGSRDASAVFTRKACVVMLEKLTEISPQIKGPTKERIEKMVKEWKETVHPGSQNHVEFINFLKVVKTFNLLSSLDMNQVMDLIVEVSRRKQIIDVCRDFIPTDRIPCLIQKLIDKRKRVEAVRYVCAFGLTKEIPPVPLLEAYLAEAKIIAKDIRAKGNNSASSQHEAISREVAALNSAIKVIEEHNLGSEISCEKLHKQVAELESQMPGKKRLASQDTKMNKPKQQTDNKRARPADHVAPYMTSTAAGLRNMSRQSAFAYDYRSSGPSIVSLDSAERLSPPGIPLYTPGGLYGTPFIHGYNMHGGAPLYPSYGSFSSLYP